MSMEDIAQDVELREWERNNIGRRGDSVRFEPEDVGYGPEECEECGAPMPVERRAWGFELCVPCKQITEMRR